MVTQVRRSDHVCARTACDRTNAVFWNRETQKFYCPRCARNIREFSPELIPWVPVPDDQRQNAEAYIAAITPNP